MNNNSISAKLYIYREKKGLLKSVPAIVLFDKSFLHFYPDDTKTLEVKSDTITLCINKKKKLTFQVLSGDKKELIIKEAISDWRFYLKYGIILLLTLFLSYVVMTNILKGQYFQGGLIGLFCCIWALFQVRHEYFILEEK